MGSATHARAARRGPPVGTGCPGAPPVTVLLPQQEHRSVGAALRGRGVHLLTLRAKVYLVTARSLRASKTWRRAMATPRSSRFWNPVDRDLGRPRGRRPLRDTVTGAEPHPRSHRLFIASVTPPLRVVRGRSSSTPKIHVVDGRTQRTNLTGVFAAATWTTHLPTGHHRGGQAAPRPRREHYSPPSTARTGSTPTRRLPRGRTAEPAPSPIPNRRENPRAPTPPRHRRDVRRRGLASDGTVVVDFWAEWVRPVPAGLPNLTRSRATRRQDPHRQAQHRREPQVPRATASRHPGR